MGGDRSERAAGDGRAVDAEPLRASLVGLVAWYLAVPSSEEEEFSLSREDECLNSGRLSSARLCAAIACESLSIPSVERVVRGRPSPDRLPGSPDAPRGVEGPAVADCSSSVDSLPLEADRGRLADASLSLASVLLPVSDLASIPGFLRADDEIRVTFDFFDAASVLDP